MNLQSIYLKKKINYTDIYRIIKKVTSLNLYSSVNTIKDIIDYHEHIEDKLKIFEILLVYLLSSLFQKFLSNELLFEIKGNNADSNVILLC